MLPLNHCLFSSLKNNYSHIFLPTCSSVPVTLCLQYVFQIAVLKAARPTGSSLFSPVTIQVLIQSNPAFGQYPLNKDTSLLRTVRFVPGEKKPLHFLWIKRSLYGHLIITDHYRQFVLSLGKESPSIFSESTLLNMDTSLLRIITDSSFCPWGKKALPFSLNQPCLIWTPHYYGSLRTVRFVPGERRPLHFLWINPA